MKAVAILSGGLDSTVALAKAKGSAEILLALTFDYGQKAAKKEIHSARKISRHYSIPHKVIQLPWLKSITSTALVHPKASLPKGEMSSRSAKAVWVPNRNGAFIEIAAAHAETLGATRLITGFNKEEAATFPDNSKPYVTAINQALSFSTANKVRVISGTINLDKKGIVRLGKSLNAPLNHIWPCYEGGKTWCRTCESCLRTIGAGL